MNHLIVCREYAPAPQPPGGIGSYVRHMASLLARAGETVHVIAQRWYGAPQATEISINGRLIVHRVSLDTPYESETSPDHERRLLHGLARSNCPTQVFSWQAMRLAEALVEQQGIDTIEGQEWEAPLYYLLARRALGLGPQRRPPCIVHLHSPSEFIFKHNDWDPTLADFLPTKRQEDYVIRNADALLCPSQYLARQVESHLGLAPDRVRVIPYPLADIAPIDRAPSVWAGHRVCYVGRIERRKGVEEWIDAAVRVSSEHPGVSFEFFGADTALDGGAGDFVQRHLLARIPPESRHRFHFRGSQPLAVLRESLAVACASVVPSRWENLPYSCIEAMATGLPVLVTPTGGMTELVSDGHSGWVSRNSSSEALADALRRLLVTPPDRRAAMGAQAAADVRRQCAPDTIVDQHLTFRSDLVTRPPVPISAVTAHDGIATSTTGVGVVIEYAADDEGDDCINSVLAQETAPTVVLMGARGNSAAVRAAVERLTPAHRVVVFESGPARAGRRAALAAVLALRPPPQSVVFCEPNDRLEASYVRTVQRVLTLHPEVAIVSPWWEPRGARDIEIRLAPEFPYQWLANDVGPLAAFRVTALADAVADTRPGPTPSPWALANAVLAAGGGAITYPELLSQAGAAEQSPGASSTPYAAAARQWLTEQPDAGWWLEPHLDRSPRDTLGPRLSLGADAIATLHASPLEWFVRAPLRQKLALITRAARNPGRTMRWVGWRVRQ